MRVLTVSDEIVPLVYSLQIKARFADVALVFGCGDLPYYYLEYVTTMLCVPCLYVLGNHDRPQLLESGEVLTGPRGCIDVDEAVVRVNGLLVAGLGGSLRYNLDDGPQFTETQMMVRCLRLATRIMWHNARWRKGLDVMLSHAPLAGVHAGADRPHRGANAFVKLQRWFRPRYWIHGHVHRSYSYGVATETHYNHTLVLNTAGYRDLTITPAR